MTENELRQGFTRLIEFKTIEIAQELIAIHLDFMLDAIQNHHSLNTTPYEGQGKLIMQMMMTKSLALHTLLKGTSFSNIHNIKVHSLIDPTIIGNVIRNVYETTVLFNTVWRQPQGQDEKIIAFNLWRIAGLTYRQKFSEIARTPENKAKVLNERNFIDSMINEIERTDFFKSLDIKNQKKIHSRIDTKEYLIQFKNNQIKCFTMSDAVEPLEVKQGVFPTVYNLFSLYTHPSYVSVFQFGDFYDEIEKGYLGFTNFLLQYYFFSISIFIADFIKVFPDAITSFEKLPILHQILINTHNNLARGYSFSINDSHMALGVVSATEYYK